MKSKHRRIIISDTHLGHSALQHHARRPANVDELITKAVDELVMDDDLVIHLGDVAFNRYPLAEWMAQRKGKWILVRGNHDSHSVGWYMDRGFAYATDGLLLGNVYFTHKPVEHLPDGAEFNVHGHIHNRVAHTFRKYPHSRLFALEHTNYKPMLLDKFLAKGMPGGEVLPPEEDNRENGND